MSSPHRTYPVFLRIDGRRCVVVGGGPIGAQKCRELLESGAVVTLISPTLGDEATGLLETWADRLAWLSRDFEADDLRGAMLAYSATGVADVDARVRGDGAKHGVLVNIVDVPDLCDFFAGSLVRRGAVTVAIGTGGASPSLAIALRERIDAVLPSTIGPIADVLAAARPRLLAAFPSYAERARRMRAWVEAALSRDRIDSTEQIVRWADNAVACTRICDAQHPCQCVRNDNEALRHAQ